MCVCIDVYGLCIQTTAIASQITICFSYIKITHPATEMRSIKILTV